MKLPQQIILWFQLNENELKGILKVFFGVLVIVLLVKSPILIRNSFFFKMDAETTAIVDKVVQNRGIQESYTGGKILIQNYQVDYHYEVGNNRYTKSDFLSRKSLNLNQRILLKRLTQGDSITIEYKSKEPEIAILKL